MRVIAHYSGYIFVDVPDNLSEDEIIDYLSGMDVQCDEVDYEVVEED